MAAVRFACMLNCPDHQADPNCSCPTCRRIASETHPDFTIERPERGMIRIERVRLLQNAFKFAPAEARFRIAVIDDAHLMNRSAQNALLKTLEEPPPARILVLVTAKPFLLLSTVRSRCRRVRFGPIPFDSLCAVLEGRMGLAPEKAQALAAAAGGSVSRALEMDTANFPRLRQQVVAALTDPGSIGIAGLLELSAAISTDRKKAIDAIEIATSWIRDLLVLEAEGGAAEVINRDLLDRMLDSAQHQDGEQLLMVYDELLRASQHVESDVNVNRNMATDVMFLRIARILAGPTLGVT
jgi:DNA polymerase III subunit delta'